MATRFEIVLHGDDPVALRAAGEEAMQEIERLEAQLSLFRPGSEIARLNALAARQPVRVTPALFSLLQHARQLSAQTSGAFDITVAPLVRCWGFMDGNGQMPDPEELARARSNVGMHLIRLDETDYTIRFEREGVMLDLGAIGKGYAIECAAELLRQAGVTSALLHGGTSSVYAIGHPPDNDAWQVSIENPAARPDRSVAGQRLTPSPPFAVVSLKDESLSVSAIWGKFFQAEGQTLGHIIDPRTGRPAHHAVLSGVILGSATETDALSTALLTLGIAGFDSVIALRPMMRALVAAESGSKLTVQTRGIPFHLN